MGGPDVLIPCVALFSGIVPFVARSESNNTLPNQSVTAAVNRLLQLYYGLLQSLYGVLHINYEPLHCITDFRLQSFARILHCSPACDLGYCRCHNCNDVVGRDMGLTDSTRHGLLPNRGSTCLIGWIYQPERPERKFRARVVLESRDHPPQEFCTLIADSDCWTVADRDGKSISCGFMTRLPVGENAVRVRVYETESQIEITGSPLHLGVAPFFEGTVEKIVNGQVLGWAWASRPAYPCQVDVLIDGKLVGVAFTGYPRPDIVAGGLGTGADGFRFQIPAPFFDDRDHEISCLFHKTRRHLRLSPLRQRLSSADPAPIADVEAILGGDGLLHGLITPKARTEAGSIDLEVLLDNKPLSKLRAYPHKAGKNGLATLSYTFSAPFCAPAGQLSFLLQGETRPRPFDPSSVAKVVEHGPSCAHLVDDEDRFYRRRQQEQHQRRHNVILLIPVWGEENVATFCELCLPALLTEGNLPSLAQEHELKIVVLTGAHDRPLLARYASFRATAELAPTELLEIDDILQRYFDASVPESPDVVVSHAFARAIRGAGKDAQDTDFIFWEANCVAGDGTFASLARRMTDGARCTVAASLKVPADVKDALSRHTSDDGKQLRIQARSLVRLGLSGLSRGRTPGTEREAEGRPWVDETSSLYWWVNDELLIARCFRPRLVHIRPEIVLEEISGAWHHAFVPQMLPNASIHHLSGSDQLCVLELADTAGVPKQAGLADAELQIAAARSLDGRVTAEQLEFSTLLAVFNGTDHDAAETPELEACADRLDTLVRGIYPRLTMREGVWYTEITGWNDTLAALTGKPWVPSPQHPRRKTTNMTRWTGYDLDVLGDNWGGAPASSLAELFANCPGPEPQQDGPMAGWLDRVFEAFVAGWLADQAVRVIDHLSISLVGAEPRRDGRATYYWSDFCGCRWGIPTTIGERWYRQLGPGGVSIILHRTTQRSAFVFTLKGRMLRAHDARDLMVSVNRVMLSHTDEAGHDEFVLRFRVPHDLVVAHEGRLIIELRDRKHDTIQPARFAFSEYDVAAVPDDWYERLTCDIGSLTTEAAMPRLPKVTRPTLSELRRLETSAVRSSSVAVDFGKSFLGVRWNKPFKRNGRTMRWMDASGVEILVIRLDPGTAYEIGFEADLSLSRESLVVNARLRANGVSLESTRIDVGPMAYRIAATVSALQVSEYSGWLAIQIVSDTFVGEPVKDCKITYNEPRSGGIAVTDFFANSCDTERAAVVPARDHGEMISSGESPQDFWAHRAVAFWKEQLVVALDKDVPPPDIRAIACQLLGVDYDWYQAQLAVLSGRVVTSWICCQEDVVADISRASEWLACVDREIEDVWRNRGSAPRPGARQMAATADDIEGAGFGVSSAFRGVPARLLSPGHPTRLFFHLRRDSWSIELDIRTEEIGSLLGQIQVLLQDEPVKTKITLISERVVLLSVEVPQTALASAGQRVVLTIQPSPERTGSRTLHLVSLIARPAYAFGLPVSRRWREPRFGAFTACLEQTAVDPELYIFASDEVGGALRDLISMLPFGASGLEADQRLVEYCDYVLATTLELRSHWTSDDRINLLGNFYGCGWGRVQSFSGHAGRPIAAGLCRGIVFSPAFDADEIEIAVGGVGCVGSFAFGDLQLFVNGSRVPYVVDAETEQLFGLRAFVQLHGETSVVLRFEVSEQQCDQISFRSVGIRPVACRQGSIAEHDRQPFGLLVAAAGLRMPFELTSDAALLPAMPRQEAVLWRFGRDPGPYRSWLRDRNGICRVAYNSCPASVDPMSAVASAWLDLIDRSIVDALLAEPAGSVRGDVIFGRGISGIGWGPLMIRAGVPVRLLSGAADGTLLISPQPSWRYSVRIKFAPDAARDALLSLKLTANRRSVKYALSFQQDGPELRVEIDPTVSDFGLGWVALRFANSAPRETESLPVAPETLEWRLSVRKVELEPSDDDRDDGHHVSRSSAAPELPHAI
jgi:hypothetical protein